MNIIEKIVSPIGRRVDESSPMVDARLPDGSRVNVIIPPLSLKGPTITIRKFSKEPFTIDNLIDFGTLTRVMAIFLEACVKARLNIFVSGGTGSGKTTSLNVLSSFIPSDERIVTIEDAAELQLSQEHVVSLESRPPNIEGKGAITIRDLVRNSLRMRPERIVIGEVRGGEALDMLQAMNTGHDGSLATGHSNSPRDMISRLETMVLMAGIELPVKAIREQIAGAIDLIIQQSRLKDGTRKITNITEVQGMEGDVIVLQDIFVFRQTGIDENGKIIGKLVPTGVRPKYFERLETSGIHIPASVFIEEE
jgi:pilus assembly protein CpaF